MSGAKAWRVNVDGVIGYAFADSAASAKWIAMRSARDAGYYDGRGEWPKILFARRARELDAIPEAAARRFFSADYLDAKMKRRRPNA